MASFLEKAEILKNTYHMDLEGAVKYVVEREKNDAVKYLKEELSLYQNYGYKEGEAKRFFVYIAKDKHVDGLYKIGKSGNLPERMKRGVTDNPFIKYIYSKELSSAQGMSKLEEDIHNQLEAYNLQHYVSEDEHLTNKEWFLLPNNVLISTILKYSFKQLS